MRAKVHVLRGRLSRDVFATFRDVIPLCTQAVHTDRHSDLLVDAFVHHLRPIQIANSWEIGRGPAQAEKAHFQHT